MDARWSYQYIMELISINKCNIHNGYWNEYQTQIIYWSPQFRLLKNANKAISIRQTTENLTTIVGRRRQRSTKILTFSLHCLYKKFTDYLHYRISLTHHLLTLNFLNTYALFLNFLEGRVCSTALYIFIYSIYYRVPL